MILYVYTYIYIYILYVWCSAFNESTLKAYVHKNRIIQVTVPETADGAMESWLVPRRLIHPPSTLRRGYSSWKTCFRNASATHV